MHEVKRAIQMPTFELVQRSFICLLLHCPCINLFLGKRWMRMNARGQKEIIITIISSGCLRAFPSYTDSTSFIFIQFKLVDTFRSSMLVRLWPNAQCTCALCRWSTPFLLANGANENKWRQRQWSWQQWMLPPLFLLPLLVLNACVSCSLRCAHTFSSSTF